MNLPNKLTLARVFMVPFAIVFVLYPIGGDTVARILAAVLFAAASLTDMLDGKIARKYHLITNFGKFLDPLADKFMVIGVLCAMVASDMYAQVRPLLVWAAIIVVLRELTVTSLRLLVASSPEKIVIAANWLGKVKTVTQIACILVLMLEPVLLPFDTYLVASYVLMAAMTVMTLWSGINYLAAYGKFINPND